MSRRVLTGVRTTGQMHLGHFVGALKQWVDVQSWNTYDCYFLLADVQALTTHAENPSLLPVAVKTIILDWLSVGLDPFRADVHFVLQSAIFERFELSGLLAMIPTWREVRNNPTVKEELKKNANPSAGFMLYAVDQAADIYMVSPVPHESGDELLVPVGSDQVPHLELARHIARDFNKKYQRNLFTPCQALVGDVGRLPGIYGDEKMGKSADNAIFLTDTKETVKDKVNQIRVPSRAANEPGETEKNILFQYHRAFNSDEDQVADLTERYQKGQVGDREVRERLMAAINRFLEPIQERRAHFANVNVREILEEGTRATRPAAKLVIEQVRDAMHLGYPT